MRFNYLSTANKSKRSQSALEYMMTYGWAILIIVIVAVILYSMGIFNPSSSITTTITGFQSLGVTQAACINSVNNQILELYVTNNVGYPINLTKINVTGNNGVTVTQDIGSLLYPGHSSSFYVNGVCNKSSSSYSGSATITYMEIGQPLPGPYISTGKVANVPVNLNPNKVGNFTKSSNNYGGSYINVSSISLLEPPSTVSVTAWVYAAHFFAFEFVAGKSCNPITCGWASYSITEGSSGSNMCGGTYTGLTCGPQIPLDTWIFVTFTYNGTNSFIYENGTVQASASTPVLSYKLYPFNIGSSLGYHSWYGMISNVQVYNNVLSAADIQKLYSEGLGGAPLPNAGLVGWWPLDGNANDYSGYNNNGVAVNVKWVSP